LLQRKISRMRRLSWTAWTISPKWPQLSASFSLLCEMEWKRPLDCKARERERDRGSFARESVWRESSERSEIESRLGATLCLQEEEEEASLASGKTFNCCQSSLFRVRFFVYSNCSTAIESFFPSPSTTCLLRSVLLCYVCLVLQRPSKWTREEE